MGFALTGEDLLRDLLLSILEEEELESRQCKLCVHPQLMLINKIRRLLEIEVTRVGKVRHLETNSNTRQEQDIGEVPLASTRLNEQEG